MSYGPKVSLLQALSLEFGFLRPEKSVVLSDCSDDNAAMRVLNRMPGRTAFVEVNDTLEAGGCLMDALDSLRGTWSTVMVNIAPRNRSDDGDHKNGTPFVSFWVDRTLVVGTAAHYTLSFLKALELVDEGDVRIYDTEDVLCHLARRGHISYYEKARIADTQFRSFEFAPVLVRILWRDAFLPFREMQRGSIPALPHGRIWLVDKFGNAKLTSRRQDIGRWSHDSIFTQFGPIKYYRRLADVPEGEAGIVSGSSGYGPDAERFLELTVNKVSGGSARTRFGARHDMDVLAHDRSSEP